MTETTLEFVRRTINDLETPRVAGWQFLKYVDLNPDEPSEVIDVIVDLIREADNKTASTSFRLSASELRSLSGKQAVQFLNAKLTDACLDLQEFVTQPATSAPTPPSPAHERS